MMYLNIDAIIFIAFLVTNFIFGMASSRGIKTIKEFAVGDRKFSTATIVSTIVATWISGEYFFTISSEAFSEGLYFIWGATLSDLVCFLLIALYFAPRMGEFLGRISIAEAMGGLFGRKVRIITAVSSFLGIAGVISIQLKAAGILFEYALGMPQNLGAIFAGVIITTYSALGGVKSVTFTDMIQCITFGIVIPVIVYYLLDNINSFTAVTDSLVNNSQYDYRAVFDFTQDKSLYYLFLFLFSAIPGFSPVQFQRISMASSPAQVTKSFTIAAFTCFMLGMAICWIGVLTFAIHPQIPPNDVLKTVISDFSYITGMKGIILLGVMAMIMSTVDSYINATSVIVVHDFLKPIGINFGKDDLISARIVSFIIGIISISLSLREESLLGMLILSYSLYMPIVSVPFIMAICGFRSSEKSVMLGMLAGFITVLFWEYYGVNAVDSIIPAMAANLLVMVSSHYILRQEGGWVGIKDTKYLRTLKDRRNTFVVDRWTEIKNFSLLRTIEQNCLKGEGFIAMMGLFVMISSFSSFNSLSYEQKQPIASLLNIIYPISLTCSTALMTYPLWLPRWKERNIISVVWFFTMLVILISFGFFTVLISEFEDIQLITFMVNIIVISSLTSWRWALFNILLGTGIISIYYINFIADYIQTSNVLGSEFKIFYLLLLVISSLVIFLRPKQEYVQRKEEQVDTLQSEVTDLSEAVTHYTERVEDQAKEIERLGATAKRILNNVNHELRLPVGNVVNFSEMLNEGLGKLDKQELKDLSKEVYDNSNRLSSMILNMLDLATLNADIIELEKSMINFSELVRDRITSCRKIYLKDKKLDFEVKIEENILVSIDPNYLRQTVDNLVINAMSFTEKGTIYISVLKVGDEVEFTIQDSGVGIPEKELFDIFTPFKMGSNTESKAEGRGVGLALCKTSIDAHGGRISAESPKGKGAKFIFYLKAIETSA